jgi:hypothetical protein
MLNAILNTVDLKTTIIQYRNHDERLREDRRSASILGFRFIDRFIGSIHVLGISYLDLFVFSLLEFCVFQDLRSLPQGLKIDFCFHYYYAMEYIAMCVL